MTESLKFGPEWLRNTVAPAIDAAANLTSQASNAGSRYPLAEFRYGREEMLSLFDKNIKLPDIYSKYKKLFVDKIQCPLALTPSTDEELEYSRNAWPTRSVGAPGSAGRGRGISAERGRGRGRGVYHPSYQRSASLYDEEGRSIGRGERPWLERNGTGEAGEYATTSPRKEYGRVGAENWRRSRTDEEGGSGGGTGTSGGSDWRSSGFTTRDTKWGAGRSWRDDEYGGKEEYQRSVSNPNGSNGIERSGPKPYSNTPGGLKKRSWGDGEGDLPEWATEDPSDYGGSFDATGAFHDSEDDDLQQRANHHHHHHQRSPPNKQTNERSEKPSIRSDMKGKNEVGPDRSSEERESYETDRRKAADEENKSNEGSLEKEVSNKKPMMINNVDNKRANKDESQNSVPPHTTELRRVAGTGRIQNISESSVDRMQEVADDMVAQLMMEDELINAFENDLGLNKPGSSPLMGNMANNRSSSASQQHPQQPPVRPNAGSTDFWFYQDPQNKVQGPFSAAEMSEWYRAGYFDETLFVRRGCDSRFSTLGDLIKICGGAMPFISSHLIPPMVTPELPPLQNPLLSVLGNSAAAAPPQQMLDDVQLKYQLHVLQKQFMMRQQQVILQKLMATEPWNMLTTEQQNTMLNHHMAQVTLPESLTSTASLVGLNPAQLQQLHQQTVQGTLFQPPSKDGPAPQQQHPQQQQQSNSHNVPSNIIMNQASPVAAANQQQQRRNAANGNAQLQQNPDQIRQLIHTMSLGHMQQPQVNSQVPPKISPIEADPIKSLIMQLSMQKNAPVQQPGVPGHPLAKPMGHQDPVFPWGIMPGNGNPQQMHLMQQQQNSNSQFHHQMRNMPGFNMLENDLDLRKNELQQQQQQQQQQWNAASPAPGSKASSLLSMWEMPPIKTPVINNGDIFVDAKTEQEQTQRQFLLEEQQRQLQLQQQMPLVEKDAKPDDDEKEKAELKEKRQSKKEQEEAAKNKHNKKEAATKTQQQQQQQQNQQNQQQSQSTKAKSAQKEADEKKRKAEEKKKTKEMKERQVVEEKRKQEEMIEQQRKSKLLEAQRRETAMKIQEEQQLAMQQQAAHNKTQQQQQQQQQQQNQRPVTQMAPWSNSLQSGPVGPSLIEIEKAERQQRAEQMRIDQAMREQREQQQLFEMQQKQESILKWNAQNIMPTAVKSLAEIQAEEHAKQTAVEKELAAQNAAKQREEDKKGVQNMASFWSTTAQQSAWNTGKIWGSGAPSNYSVQTGGGFWEEPTKVATNQKGATSTKMLAKSQTMGSITTNKAAQKEQKAKQPAVAASPNVPKTLTKVVVVAAAAAAAGGAAGVKIPKSDKKNDDSFNAEFNNWCCKALHGLNAEVDVPTFVGFLHDIESPYEIKDYIKMYLGETKECIEFSKQFLERRSKLKNQQRAQNAHIDDMCSPAPALTPNDFQEVKNKTKKVKKGKMTKVDSRMLGFSVTASPHWNLEKNMESS